MRTRFEGGARPQRKVCPKCGRSKPLDGFGTSRKRVDGRDVYCRDCRREYYDTYRAKNAEYSERIRERARRQPATDRAEVHKAVKKAIAAGRIVKPKGCERCGAKQVNPRLDRPGDLTVVRWYCRRCRQIVDDAVRNGERFL